MGGLDYDGYREQTTRDMEVRQTETATWLVQLAIFTVVVLAVIVVQYLEVLR